MILYSVVDAYLELKKQLEGTSIGVLFGEPKRFERKDLLAGRVVVLPRAGVGQSPTRIGGNPASRLTFLETVEFECSARAPNIGEDSELTQNEADYRRCELLRSQVYIALQRFADGVHENARTETPEAGENTFGVRLSLVCGLKIDTADTTWPLAPVDVDFLLSSELRKANGTWEVDVEEELPPPPDPDPDPEPDPEDP